MTILRRSFRDHPRLLLWLAVLAFAVKLLVPAGYMPVVDAGRVAIVTCPGVTASHHMPRGHDAPAKHDAPDTPCAFTGLGASAIGTAEPVARTIGVVLAVVIAARPPSAPPTRDAGRWRPPLRAPPFASIR